MKHYDLCALCYHSAGGFYLFGASGQPDYRACSTACLDAIAALSKETGTMMMKTQMEQEAIFQARRPLYEKLVACEKVRVTPLSEPSSRSGATIVDGLVSINVADVFAALTAEQIDGIIETIWDAVRNSMQLQSAQGEVPVQVGGPPYQQPARHIPFAASPPAQFADRPAAGGPGSATAFSQHSAPGEPAQTAGGEPYVPTPPAGSSAPHPAAQAGREDTIHGEHPPDPPPPGPQSPSTETPPWEPPRSAELPNDPVNDLWRG